MPETAVIPIAVTVLASVAGLLLGWFTRGGRAAKERTSIIAGWRERFDAQRDEQERLLSQNRYLMEQVGELQALDADAGNRARELAAALKEAFAQRDELQHQIKEIRGNLEAVVVQRDHLQADIANGGDTTRSNGTDKDNKIFRLSRELVHWQQRLPPLLARFRARDKRVRQLELELDLASRRIASLEERLSARTGATGEARLIPAVPEPTGGAVATTVDPESDMVSEAASARAAGANGSDTVTTPRDNLRLIKGVGPAIEKTLNELGIFRFRQLARLRDRDVERSALRFRGARSRIERENWVGQARELDLRQSAVETGLGR